MNSMSRGEKGARQEDSEFSRSYEFKLKIIRKEFFNGEDKRREIKLKQHLRLEDPGIIFHKVDTMMKTITATTKFFFLNL